MTEDQNKALAFLVGIVDRDKQGLPTLRYLDGEEEKEGRAALVRLLVSRKLSRELFYALALLFDPQALDKEPVTVGPPETATTSPHWNASFRRVEFVRRLDVPRKRYERGAIGFEIYCRVYSDPRIPLAEAKAEAAEKYGLSLEAIQSIWEEHGRIWVERLPGLH